MDVMHLPIAHVLSVAIDSDCYEKLLSIRLKNESVFSGRICDLKWRIDNSPRRPHSTYCRTCIVSGGKGHSLWLHRFVMQAPHGVFVDHIDGNGLNCTRTNLRFSDVRRNGHNRRKIAIKSSQFKGVSKNRRGKWVASIKHFRVNRYLGTFVAEESAALAYDNAARELFGETALLNF